MTDHDLDRTLERAASAGRLSSRFEEELLLRLSAPAFETNHQIEAGSGSDVAPVPDEPPGRRAGRVRLLVAAAVIAVVGVGGAVALRAGDGSSTVETDPVDTREQLDSTTQDIVPQPRPSGARGDTLKWELGAVPGDPSGFIQMMSDGKTLYWIGSRIYSSVEGKTWTEVELDDGPVPGLVGQGMVDAVWAGQLVVSEAGGANVRVEIVGLNGSSRIATLSAQIDSDTTTMVGVHGARATIGPRGVVVAARLSVLDFGPLIIDVLGADAGLVESIQLDDDGVSETLVVQLPNGSERVRLLDHGIVDSQEPQVAPTGPIGWHTTDGTNWTPIPAVGPFVPGDHTEVNVTATTGGFVAFDSTGQGWFSTDGASWPEIDGQTDPLGGGAVIAWSDQALALGRITGLQTISDQGFASLPLTDADAWSTFGRSFGAGEGGIAYLVDVDPDAEIFDIVYSPDGISWQRQALPEGIGDLYCCFFDVYGVVVGREQVAVLADGDHGLELWLATPTTQENS
jgi:hypothetical protein